jgi:glycosyltransferase involved in cell wall biosynthesis
MNHHQERALPFISVVIPVGRVDAIESCLRALACQTLPRQFFEVILVLDGVSLQLTAISPNWRIRHLKGRSGRSSARNCGLDAAKGVVAVSLDCDMVACPDLLKQYYEAHQNPSVACVGVREFALPSIKDRFDEMHAARLTRLDYRENFYKGTGYLRNAAEPFWAFSTCNCSYPIDLARQVGLFDEQMAGWGLEDIEFAYRLWCTGNLEFRWLEGAAAIHVEHDRDKSAEAKAWAANRGYCVRKHGDLFRDPGHRRSFGLAGAVPDIMNEFHSSAEPKAASGPSSFPACRGVAGSELPSSITSQPRLGFIPF